MYRPPSIIATQFPAQARLGDDDHADAANTLERRSVMTHRTSIARDAQSSIMTEHLGGLRGAGFRRRLITGNSRGSPHEIRRVDVLHRLFDRAGGARGCARGTRLRHCLGARAFAHPDIAQVELYSGERAAQALLRRHGPVCDADRCRDGDHDVEGRNRRLSCCTAGSDPDRQAGRLDRPSLGRALRLRVGNGWNEDEMENHGTAFATRHKRARENIEAMKEIWTRSEAEYHGEFVNFDPMMAWPKPVQKPYPSILVGGAFPYSARRAIRYGDGWMPQVTERSPTPLIELIPKFPQMCAEADRDPDKMDISLGGQSPDADLAKRYRDAGVNRVSTSLPSEKAGTILPILDEWVAVMRAVNS